MEALLLGIYSFFVWLIFIKFKWLPWTPAWKITVVIIPIVGLTAMILALTSSRLRRRTCESSNTWSRSFRR